jgi:hypothetical protein
VTVTVTVIDIHSDYEHTVRCLQPPSVHSTLCVTLLVKYDALLLSPATFSTLTCSFPSLVPVMTYRPPGANATETPYPVLHVLRQECRRVDQIFTPSLLQVAACSPSEERHTALTSDLRERKGERLGEGRSVCLSGVECGVTAEYVDKGMMTGGQRP